MEKNRTFNFKNNPKIASYAAIAGKKEGEGPLSEYFDVIMEDALFGESTWEKAERKMFKQAINLLNARERDILYKRRLAEDNSTLDDLSQYYHISKERVRQIELNSIKKISRAVGAVN